MLLSQKAKEKLEALNPGRRQPFPGILEKFCVVINLTLN